MVRDIIDIERILKADTSGKSNLILIQELLVHTRISISEIRNLLKKYCKGDYNVNDETIIARELHKNQSNRKI
jgi:hypothetical protein